LSDDIGRKQIRDSKPKFPAPVEQDAWAEPEKTNGGMVKVGMPTEDEIRLGRLAGC
jgi:hypothetical protein